MFIRVVREACITCEVVELFTFTGNRPCSVFYFKPHFNVSFVVHC